MQPPVQESTPGRLFLQNGRNIIMVSHSALSKAQIPNFIESAVCLPSLISLLNIHIFFETGTYTIIHHESLVFSSKNIRMESVFHFHRFSSLLRVLALSEDSNLLR